MTGQGLSCLSDDKLSTIQLDEAAAPIKLAARSDPTLAQQ